jgi:formylglycine-generating enzyme required for sulfatase activity
VARRSFLLISTSLLLSLSAAAVTAQSGPCPNGMVRPADAPQCCWPEQHWSQTTQRCEGSPRCPAQFIPEDSGCVAAPAPVEGMVRVPAGPFLRGSLEGYHDERPQRQITLDAFWIDLYEVTVAEYRACVEAEVCEAPAVGTSYHNWGRPDRDKHPVNGVSWQQAVTFCQWKGKRLPTEAEWEKAARGVDGRLFPWGDEAASCALTVMTQEERGCGQDRTWEVGSHPRGKSLYGAHDMAGNVWEWVADWYSPTAYADAPAANPRGPERGRLRVHRGGAWFNTGASLRAAMRNAEPPQSGGYIGFRCAR